MIEKYIVELLEKNNRVIVPDFGAFLRGSGSSKNIFFNEFIKVDDGLLITSIIKNEKISRNEVAQEIAEFIEKVKKELSEKQKSNVEGMGVLFKDEKGRIRLKVDENVIKEKIPDKPTMSKVEEKKEENNKKKENVIPNTKITKKQTTMENKNPLEKKKTPTEKKKQKTLLIVLLILIPIIIIAVLGYLYQDKIFGSSADNEVVKKEVVKTEVDKTEIEKQKAAEALDKKAKIAIEEKAKEDIKIAAKEKAKKELAQKQKKYYLVGGVFKEIQNAEDYLTELEYEGFSDVKYINIDELNYLCYSSFESLSEAKTELQNIKDKGYEVWILKH